MAFDSGIMAEGNGRSQCPKQAEQSTTANEGGKGAARLLGGQMNVVTSTDISCEYFLTIFFSATKGNLIVVVSSD
jgi:hypothetical protein